jgi:nucleotide-binding universal stress UspA family protein
MISKILIPTDGSKQAKKSVEYAVRFAEQLGASITFLSVVDKSSFVPLAMPGTATPTGMTEPIEDYLRQAAESYLQEAQKFCGKYNVQSKTVVRSGHPVEEIIKEARKSKVDIVVIGSQGRSALKAAVIGSVAFGVINKESKIPVLVVRN